VFIYALSYPNPYDARELFALFVASQRPLEPDDVIGHAVQAVTADGLGHEWVEAVAAAAVAGPLLVEGTLSQPSVAIIVDDDPPA